MSLEGLRWSCECVEQGFILVIVIPTDVVARITGTRMGAGLPSNAWKCYKPNALFSNQYPVTPLVSVVTIVPTTTIAIVLTWDALFNSLLPGRTMEK
jgi:hypothetical protein